MTKRAAMLMAAGLVAALAAGAMALSFGLTGNGPAQAETKEREPIVRTIRRTVRVEKPAKDGSQPIRVIELASGPASNANTVSAPATASDDGFEDEGYEDEGYEDDGSEHDGSEHESEDHSEGGDEHEGEYAEAGDDG